MANDLDTLREQFERLFEQDRSIIRELRAFDPETVAAKPGEDAWSLLNIADHLALVARRSSELVRKNLDAEDFRGKTGIKASLSSLLLKTILRTPIRVKVPTKAVLPADTSTLDSVERMWQEAHQRWLDILGEISQEDLERALFQHPIGGWYNIRQTLDFLAAHTEHHQAQLQRTKAALGLPR